MISLKTYKKLCKGSETSLHSKQCNSLTEMFTIRARHSENIDKRQKKPFFDISASGANIPLKEEDWQNRWCSLPMNETAFRPIYEFEVREDDVFVVTFPKCGTTWIQEATWLLQNDLDFNRANKENLSSRSIFLDFSALYSHITKSTVESANKAPSPRVLKSHLPAHLIPKEIWEKKCKIVYCARNPRDMAASFYHFHRGLGTWQGDLSDFIEDSINDDIMYAPYWEHIMDFWRMREEKNIFFTTYEAMKKDLRTILIDLNKFLQKPDLTAQQLNELENHLSFDNMKANNHLNPTLNIKSGYISPNVRDDFQFMRRGLVGSYKHDLPLEDQKKLNIWINDNLNKFNIKLEDIFGNI